MSDVTIYRRVIAQIMDIESVLCAIKPRVNYFPEAQAVVTRCLWGVDFVVEEMKLEHFYRMTSPSSWACCMKRTRRSIVDSMSSVWQS